MLFRSSGLLNRRKESASSSSSSKHPAIHPPQIHASSIPQRPYSITHSTIEARLTMLGCLERKCRVLRTLSRGFGLAVCPLTTCSLSHRPGGLLTLIWQCCAALYKRLKFSSCLPPSSSTTTIQHRSFSVCAVLFPVSSILHGLFLPGQLTYFHPAPVLVKGQYQSFSLAFP